MSTSVDRVVLLTPTLAGADGVSCLARQWAGALAQLQPPVGVSVWTLTEDGIPEGTCPSGVTVRPFGGSRVRYAAHALSAARHSWRGTVVVVLHLHLLPVAWPLVRRGARLVPVLVGIEAWRPLDLLRRTMIGRAPSLVAISAHTVRGWAKANPSLAERPVTICHPALPPAVVPGDLPVPAMPPFALIVGRMARDERYKGHDLLIDVWPQVRARAPEARLVVAGGGDDLPRLRDRVSAAGLDGSIGFTGIVPPAALAALYEHCAFFVLPSRHEGFGFVLLEAMAHGRACIGGVGAASEIIEHGRTGVVIDPDRSADLVDALVSLFTDEPRRRQFGEAGRARAREAFAFDRFARDVSAIMMPAPVPDNPC
ncbi:MAG: glycosyltransferase family 4 protein [Vicinamibacterales bacterium]|nr:glycosyltransferase family 4 protein [Vicinamibacterales bacterium]